jgi:hypothetical protein
MIERLVLVREGLVLGILERSGGDAQAAAASVSATLDKAWIYHQRAHVHAEAIGASAIGVSLMLSFQDVETRSRRVASGRLDLGAVGYPLFRMLPARSSPRFGSTGAAKESLAWLAVPSTAALVVGLALSHGLVAGRLYWRRETS